MAMRTPRRSASRAAVRIPATDHCHSCSRLLSGVSRDSPEGNICTTGAPTAAANCRQSTT